MCSAVESLARSERIFFDFLDLIVMSETPSIQCGGRPPH